MIRRKAGWNGLLIAGSVLLCLLLLPTRWPGMELLGVSPNWLLIWVVAWSLKTSRFQGVVAGFALGLIQDGMMGAYPFHGLGLAIVGYLTASLEKDRYFKEDFISVALIVFVMTAIAETVMALLLSLHDFASITDIWETYPIIVLSSAILTSLWAPIFYFPFNYFWEKLKP